MTLDTIQTGLLRRAIACAGRDPFVDDGSYLAAESAQPLVGYDN